METWSSIEHSRLGGVFEPLQRFKNLSLPRNGSFALFFLFLDDFLRRVGDEFFVRQLGIDALDIGIGLSDFLVEAGTFGRYVD
jgi:hypothetical protein